VLILEYLFKKDAFSHLVFQGGTALRLVYGGVRYSEDLDFVLKEKNSPLFGSLAELLKGLPSYLEKFVLFAGKIYLKAQKQTPFLSRFSLIVEAEELRALDKTNLEIVNVPSYENGPALVRHAGLPGSAPAVRAESLKEILSDKFCAFGSREYVKGRDIWDIYFLRNSLNVPFDGKAREMAGKKTEDYGLGPLAFLKGFRKNLTVLEEKGLEILELEMSRFLPPAYQNVFREKYASVVERVQGELGGFYKEFRKG
jgi:predicted nucleotidyltransferase component of viral defense system